MATLSVDQLTVLHQGPVATVCRGLFEQRPVAVKVFPTKFDRHTLAEYERELTKLRALPPNAPILRPDSIDQLTDGRPALRMELCPQSLSALLERVGTLPVSDVLNLGYGIARALAHAHGAGIVHGGLTPNNVLFRASGEPLVTDFGTAPRRAFTRDPMRFIEFLPPETVRTDNVDPHTDLYGLGAIMHLALTGTPPHPGRLGEPPGERVLRILGEPVPAIDLPGVPVALSTMVARLLTADRAHRPRDATAIATALAALLVPSGQQPRQAESAAPVEPPGPDGASADVTRPVSPVELPPDPFPAPEPDLAPETEGEDADVTRPVSLAELPPEPATAAEAAPEPAEEFDDFAQEPVDEFAERQLLPTPPEPVHQGALSDGGFDDFGTVPKATPVQPRKPGKRAIRVRRDVVIGGSVLAGLVAIGLVILLPGDPPELNTTPRLPPVAGANPTVSAGDNAHLVLDDPTDLGDQVVLNWTSSPGDLDYAVVIAAQGRPNRVLLADREHTKTIAVDPLAKYCFLIQATNGSQVFQSAPKPIRGAVCHL
jgi:serine/threonine protein kinase